jgi:hypothetical protein
MHFDVERSRERLYGAVLFQLWENELLVEAVRSNEVPSEFGRITVGRCPVRRGLIDLS